MKTIFKISLLFAAALASLSLSSAVFAQSVPQVQTNSATNIQNNSATLNASALNLGGDNSSITVWFQWGITTNYGNQTPQQSQGSAGSFSQNITGLSPNTTYHFQVAAQNRYGIVYGQDLTFYTNQSGSFQNNFNVQTNSATNISSNQATLNGYLSGSNFYNASAWFQYGIDTNYGNTTPLQTISYSGSISRNITGLTPNTTYHFRAAAQGNFGTVYGQDMTFYSSGSNNYYGNYGSGYLTVGKQVINLSSGNLNWQSSVSANQGDILSFAITLQANNQDIHNVFVRDILPAGLIYKGNLLVNTNSNYGGDITSGINIGTVYAGQAIVVDYQAQVANYSGSSVISNGATITSNEAGTQTASATVIVSAAPVVYGGPTYVSTGVTNNPVTDSFFLPVLLIILGSWFYFSGNVYKFSDWLAKHI